jgi:hypothetical protein
MAMPTITTSVAVTGEAPAAKSASYAARADDSAEAEEAVKARPREMASIDCARL